MSRKQGYGKVKAGINTEVHRNLAETHLDQEKLSLITSAMHAAVQEITRLYKKPSQKLNGGLYWRNSMWILKI